MASESSYLKKWGPSLRGRTSFALRSRCTLGKTFRRQKSTEEPSPEFPNRSDVRTPCVRSNVSIAEIRLRPATPSTRRVQFPLVVLAANRSSNVGALAPMSICHPSLLLPLTDDFVIESVADPDPKRSSNNPDSWPDSGHSRLIRQAGTMDSRHAALTVFEHCLYLGRYP